MMTKIQQDILYENLSSSQGNQLLSPEVVVSLPKQGPIMIPYGLKIGEQLNCRLLCTVLPGVWLLGHSNDEDVVMMMLPLKNSSQGGHHGEFQCAGRNLF